MAIVIALAVITLVMGAAASPWLLARPAEDRIRRGPQDTPDFEHALVQSALKMNAPLNRRLRRAMDIVFSLTLLLLTFPLLIAAALAVKLDGPGPVIYRQTRIGQGGRAFKILKLRSMAVNAEALGPQYARHDDSRATRIGRILRKYHIDELPQVLNVLRGEMSLIGPRPERPEFTSVFEREISHYAYRHLVRPGITGWAQVSLSYADCVEDARDKLVYDLDYIRRHSLVLDLLILVKTVRVALFGLSGVRSALREEGDAPVRGSFEV